MYINKFSTGTILALLALSGMLFLVPLAVPVHASNASSPTYTFNYGSVIYATDSGQEIAITVTNPSTNQYAITEFTFNAPSGWTVTGCDWDGPFVNDCISSSGSVLYTTSTAIPPGSSNEVYIYVTSPSQIAPFSGTFTTTIQDASSNAFYAGGSFSVQAIAKSSELAVTGVAGGSNTLSQYTAGTAPYTVTAQVTCTSSTDATCPSSNVQNGVTINWVDDGTYTDTAVYSYTPSSGVTTGSGSSGGETTTTFQPSNVVADGSGEPEAIIGVVKDCTACMDIASGAIATVAATPHSVSFYSGTSGSQTAFPSTIYISTPYTTTHYVSGTTTFKGAGIADSGTTEMWVAVSDAFGNPETFDSTSLPSGSLVVTVQAASGAYFDAASPLSSTYIIVPNPSSPTNYDGINVNYVQPGNYGTVGVVTATITGYFNGNSFSVSGSSGNIVTGVYTGTTNAFQTTSHAAFASATAKAGSTTTFEFAVIPPAGYSAQSGVPVVLGVCPNHLCSGTSAGYSGTFSGASTVSASTNSSGLVSGTLTVSTTLLATVAFNATESNPTTTSPKATSTFDTGSNVITTVAGSATKFEVVVGPETTETPSPISFATPGETVYVNVITTDNYGNIVTNVQPQQIEITLNANPATVTAPNPTIPQGCAMTNSTTSSANNPCTGGSSSFGPIAWTLPSTVGSVATISASGVLNGVSVTSATTSITIVSASPTLSVTSPTPVNGYLYTNTVNVQFQGWANVSKGYNSVVTGSNVVMSTLGYKIGSNDWVSNDITGDVNSQWSVIATLPQGLSTVNFNATDSKGNVVVLGTPYNVLVDLTTPTITFVTSAGATVNGTNPLTFKIVSAEGDLNASSVGITYNGTALASSAISVTGTNNPGTSVTYTVTATLPVGKWSVVATGTTLAGNTGTSSAEIVTQIVTNTGSFTIVGTPSQTNFANNPDTVTGVYKNNLAATQTITVVASVSNSLGQQIGFATATITISAGSTQTFYLGFVGLTPGQHYTVAFTAYSSTGVVGSVQTTVSITA